MQQDDKEWLEVIIISTKNCFHFRYKIDYSWRRGAIYEFDVDAAWEDGPDEVGADADAATMSIEGWWDR